MYTTSLHPVIDRVINHFHVRNASLERLPTLYEIHYCPYTSSQSPTTINSCRKRINTGSTIAPHSVAFSRSTEVVRVLSRRKRFLVFTRFLFLVGSPPDKSKEMDSGRQSAT